MMNIRKASERGRGEHGWLDSHHTFSFGDYHDARHMGFGALRVINDDRVAAGAGFPTHPHRDMEIISYVVEGALEHRDSEGNGSVVRPGDVQRMSAGTGIRHSEYNPSADEALRFLQIWVIPDVRGIPPEYEQRHFGDDRNGRLRLVASPDGREDSLRVHQDFEMYAAVLTPGQKVRHELDDRRRAWVQIVRGQLRLGEHELHEGDGAAVSELEWLELEAVTEAELLLFDLA